MENTAIGVYLWLSLVSSDMTSWFIGILVTTKSQHLLAPKTPPVILSYVNKVQRFLSNLAAQQRFRKEESTVWLEVGIVHFPSVLVWFSSFVNASSNKKWYDRVTCPFLDWCVEHCSNTLYIKRSVTVSGITGWKSSFWQFLHGVL